MSERFTAATGRKIISSANAEELGNLTRLVVDTESRRILWVVVGKRRAARLVTWDHISAFGADAIIVDDEASLHEPQNDREQAAAKGRLDIIGKRAISELGNALGTVADVTFDTDSGALETIMVGDDEQPAAALLGAGSFAAIFGAGPDVPEVAPSPDQADD